MGHRRDRVTSAGGRRGAMVPHARARPGEGPCYAPGRDCQIRGARLVPVVVGTPRTAGLIRLGITETLSRRRLIAYLVRADLRRRARTRCWATSGGWSTPAPDAGLLGPGGRDPGQRRGRRLSAVHLRAILPWKWFESTVKDGAARDQPGAPDQADLLPQARAAGRRLAVGRRELRVRPHPAVRPDAAGLPGAHVGWLLLIPVIGRGPAGVLGRWRSRGRVNVFYRDIGNLARHLLRFWFYLSPALYGIDEVVKLSGEHRSDRAGWFAQPWTYLLGAYRNLIYDGRPRTGRPLVLLVASIVLLALTILLFKRLEPSFAKVL